MLTTDTPAPTVTIRARAFDPAQTAGSVLCLEVGHDRLRLLVRDPGGRGCYLSDYTFPLLLTERSLTDRLPDVFRNHAVLSAGPWAGVRIGVNAPSFTLVPTALYRKEYAGSYLALMRGSALPTHEFASAYAHEGEDLLSVFGLEHPLADYFSETYPLQPLTFVHQIGTLVEATADIDRHRLTPRNVYLYFEDEFVSIIYRHEHQLRYCNRFGYKHASDLAYYVLYVLDELKLNPTDIQVMLYGEITAFAETYPALSRFLPHLTFGHPPPGLSLTAEFDELPAHRYLSLYGLGLMSE